MVDKSKKIEVVNLCDSDEEDGQPRVTQVRGDSARKTQERGKSGLQHSSQSQTKNRQNGSKSLEATPRTGSKTTRLGSQQSDAPSQQQSKRSTPSANNSTLAQRVAGREPELRGGSGSRQNPHITTSSNEKPRVPPASQVQISRGVGRASSTVLPEMDSSKGSQDPSRHISNKKRSLDDAGKVQQSSPTKRLKAGQRQGNSTKQQPTARHSNTTSGTNPFAGPGNAADPIDISDSSPPREIRRKRAGGSSRLDNQGTPQSVRTLASNSAGRKAPAVSPKPKPTSATNQGDGRKQAADPESYQRMKSPTIPESLPGSPEIHRASSVGKDGRASLPLFIRPSDETNGESLRAGVEAISDFAEQAEALLASQSDDTGVTAGSDQLDDHRSVLRPSSDSLQPHSKAASQPKHHGEDPSLVQDQPKTVLPGRGHDKALVLPATRSLARNTPVVSPKILPPSNVVEQVVIKYTRELQDDNVYWNRTWLKQARQATTAVNWSGHAPTSVFRDIKPVEPVPTSEEKRTSDIFARFTVEKMNGSGKGSKRPYALPCTMSHTPADADVPDYSHFVNIRQSFLAQNETVLQHWPYFGDEFDIEGEAVELDSQYYVDIDPRERKIRRLAQAENYAEYVEDMLRDIDCTWSDVLRFLLDPRPDVGTNSEARAALRDRDKFNDEDFARGGQRWTTVLSKLPPSDDADRIGRAALLCEYFKKIAKFQIWHVARRSGYTAKLLEQKDPTLDSNELTCRVCYRFGCPYHGELNENAPDDSDGEGSAADEVVQTDIIHPSRVNYRSRVPFPRTVDAREIGCEIDSRRKRLEYWHKQNLNHYADDRPGPFYPCYHPGTTCEKSRCSCYENRIPCEKTCACDSSCKRKWQGCDCRMKAGRICFEDTRCACFQYGRECDADLCGECGVSEVLDPIHRHDDTILENHCSNASIQRGVPRHTVLGKSGIHGLGLYACEKIRQHEFVGEYRGEIITKNEAERRGAVYEHQKLSYLFTLNNTQEVDSTIFGSKIRFINHAVEKQANLYPRVIMVNTVFRIALYGARELIKPGEELLFDYGAQFPQDQLGVTGDKNSKERKAAPHVRNKNLVAQFSDVVSSIDNNGLRRARKAAGGDKRGKLASQGALGGRERSLIARKSTAFQPSSHRASRGRARDSSEEQEDNETTQTPFDDMDLDAGQRLSSYNVADDDVPIPPDDDEDDDFEPPGDRGGNERGMVESSSTDGDNEEDDEDEDDGTVMPIRPRSSRRRR